MTPLRKTALYKRFFISNGLQRSQTPLINTRKPSKAVTLTISVLSSISLLAITISLVLLAIVEMTLFNITLSVIGISVMAWLQAIAIHYFIDRMNSK